jgi:hypothetical protein
MLYLYHVQTAIHQVTYSQSGQPPVPGESNGIDKSWSNLLRNATWKDYLQTFYSKSLIQSSLSEKYCRSPDLKDLPTADGKHISHFPRSFTRLPRFALAVVKLYMTTKLPRTWVVNQALSIFQQATIRLRHGHADNVDMYSETQTYFWITYINLLVSHFYAADIPSLQFQHLITLSAFDIHAWTTHYSTKRWSSIEARMQFMQPDLKPLVPIINKLSVIHITPEHNREVRNLGFIPEMASDEELSLALAVTMRLVEGVVSVDELDLKIHAHALLWLFHSLVKNRVIQLCTPDFEMAKSEMCKRGGLGKSYVDGIARAMCNALSEDVERWTTWPSQVETRNEMFRKFLIEHKELLCESHWKGIQMEPECVHEDDTPKGVSEEEKTETESVSTKVSIHSGQDTIDEEEKKEVESFTTEISRFTEKTKLDDEDDDDDAVSRTWEVL